MRTIKFRGKRIDNGEWVYGNHITNKNQSFIDVHFSGNWRDCSFPFRYYEVGLYEVDPATVGQFTGLLDKNGKEIYEGDVIKTDRGYAGDFYVEESESVIIFDTGEFLPKPLSKDTYFLPDGNWYDISQITGTIHD